MKRIITIILTFTLIFSSLAISSFAASSSGGKYVKVKKATYLKYKKAYNEQKQLKKQLKIAKSKLKALQRENDSLQNENEVLKDQLGNIGPNDDIDELKHRLEQQEDINDWLWMSINSLGLSYSNHIWTVPTEFPSSFMINGSKYTVRRE